MHGVHEAVRPAPRGRDRQGRRHARVDPPHVQRVHTQIRAVARPVDLRQLNRREEIRPGLLVCLAILEPEISGHTHGDRSQEDAEHGHELEQALSTLCLEKPQNPHGGRSFVDVLVPHVESAAAGLNSTLNPGDFSAALAVFLLGFAVVYCSIVQSRLEKAGRDQTP